MPFMGTDLGKLMKMERLSQDRVQFLVYQILKGLKVRVAYIHMHKKKEIYLEMLILSPTFKYDTKLRQFIQKV